MCYSPRQLAFLATKSDLRNVCALIERENPDVIIINELIHELHREKFEAFLTKKRFQCVAWGLAKHLPGATVATVVASKREGTIFPLEVHQVPGRKESRR